MVHSLETANIVKFIKPYYPETDTEIITAGIERYRKRGTFDYALDNDLKVVAVVLYELRLDNTVIHVKDLIIRKDWWGKKMFKDFAARALQRHPTIKRISFSRERRDDARVRNYDFMKFTWRLK